jgi:hypothetical protein
MTQHLASIFVFAIVVTAAVRAEAQPTNLTASVEGNTVVLAWLPAPGDVTGYLIEAGSASGLANLVVYPYSGRATSLTAANVPTGTYFVRVRAFLPSAGLTAASNEVRVEVGGCVIVPPNYIASSVVGTTMTLKWSEARGAVAYRLEAGSAPGASDVFAGELGSLTSIAVPVAPGTYFVRLRTRVNCGLSAPSNDTLVRVGIPAGIRFNAAGPHGTDVVSYTEGGFAVDVQSASWTVLDTTGNPLPSIQFSAMPTLPFTIGQLQVTAGGEPFTFTSVDLYSSATQIPYSLTGLLNGVPQFILNGTVPQTFGRFATVSGPTVNIPIDTLIIGVSNVPPPTCAPCAANPMGVDNIAVSR